MVRKSPSVIRASLFLLISVVLVQCQIVPKTPTLEPTSAQEQPATRGSDAEIVAFLSDYLDRLAGNLNFSGVVYFARDESVLFHRAYGLANRSYNVRNTTDTRFNLASASKMFTAVAIAKLVEEGQLSYDDPIGTYLDTDWVSQEVGATVQVKHLLNHTSGLGHYWDDWDDYANTIRQLDDYKPIISDELAFEPGTDYQYSNSGYLLLGAIIEKITGKTYYEHMQRVIFDPCGMADTGFYEMDIPHPNLATGYYEDEEDDGKLKNNTLFLGVRGASDGGAWSTATDMHRFVLALRSDMLVNSDTREILWTPKPMSPEYGYGFQIRDHWVGHWGGFTGFEAFVFYFPASGHTFVTFSNYWDSALPLIDRMEKRFQKLDQR
jgi:CubicO group peptidase (beta-lactamase class C family)